MTYSQAVKKIARILAPDWESASQYSRDMFTERALWILDRRRFPEPVERWSVYWREVHDFFMGYDLIREILKEVGREDPFEHRKSI